MATVPRTIRLANVAELIPDTTIKIDEPTVARLMRSIPQVGLREPVVVVGRHIKHGLHRWEACRRLKIETIEVVEDDPAPDSEIVELQRIAENTDRRHMTDAELRQEDARYVELATKVRLRRTQIDASQKGPDATFTKNENNTENITRAEVTSRAQAVRDRAQARGVKPRAINKSVAKHAADKAATAAAQKRVSDAMAGVRISNLDEYDNQIPDDQIAYWELARSELPKLSELMRQAVAICNRLEKCRAVDHGSVQRWTKDVHAVGYDARVSIPFAICPKCGGKRCGVCHNLGFVNNGLLTRSKYEQITGISCHDDVGAN